MDCFRGYWISSNNSFGLHSGGGTWGLGPKRPKGSCFVIPVTSTPEDSTKLLVCFNESDDNIAEEYYLYGKKYPFLKVQSFTWDKSKKQITFKSEKKQNSEANTPINKTFLISESNFEAQASGELSRNCDVRKSEQDEYRGYWWMCSETEHTHLSIDTQRPKGIKLEPFRK